MQVRCRAPREPARLDDRRRRWKPPPRSGRMGEPFRPWRRQGAYDALHTVLTMAGADIWPPACVAVPVPRDVIGADGLIADAAITTMIGGALEALVDRIAERRRESKALQAFGVAARSRSSIAVVLTSARTASRKRDEARRSPGASPRRQAARRLRARSRPWRRDHWSGLTE